MLIPIFAGITIFLVLAFIFSYIFSSARKQAKEVGVKNQVQLQSQPVLNLSNLRIISEPSHFLSTPKGYNAQNDYYFDENFFYAIASPTLYQKYPLAEITEVIRTRYTAIGRAVLWKVVLGNEIEFLFRHNYRFWNRNFPDFLKLVKVANPAANTTTFSLLRL